jgi:hypothetical protein
VQVAIGILLAVLGVLSFVRLFGGPELLWDAWSVVVGMCIIVWHAIELRRRDRRLHPKASMDRPRGRRVSDRRRRHRRGVLTAAWQSSPRVSCPARSS